MRNSQTPPRHEPKPAKTAPQKNCLTLLSDALKKDETRPCKTHLQTKNQPLGSPCETAKHHLVTSPNQPKPQHKKTAYTAAFWCPKERWNWTMSSPTSQNHPSETVSKKALTLRSDALQKDDERPAQQPDNPLQAAAEPGQKYGGMAASPYRKMKKGQRRPHGVGPKDPKHGFFGALPLRQRGRRIIWPENLKKFVLQELNPFCSVKTAVDLTAEVIQQHSVLLICESMPLHDLLKRGSNLGSWGGNTSHTWMSCWKLGSMVSKRVIKPTYKWGIVGL